MFSDNDNIKNTVNKPEEAYINYTYIKTKSVKVKPQLLTVDWKLIFDTSYLDNENITEYDNQNNR